MSTRKLALSAILSIGLWALPASVFAGPISIIGNAMGCFGSSCTAVDNASTFGGLLEYKSNSFVDFSGSTDPIAGTLAINNGTGNFGRFELDPANPQFVSTQFSLLLNFLAPDVSDATFSAQLFGVISTNSSGGLNVIFSPTTLTLPFTSGGQSGLLDVYVFNTAVPSGGSADINGYIVARSVPEPASALLFGIGTFGLVSLKRRNRR